MKKIFFLLLLASLSFGQTRTSNFQLPQWNTGDTLKAGTANDTSQSNFSLNNAISRLDAIVGRRLDSAGNHKTIGGSGTGNLIINAGVLGGTAVRISLADSLYGSYNWQTEGSLLVQGNTTVGGYITTDSLQTVNDFWIQNGLQVGGNVVFYDTVSSLSEFSVGASGTTKGYIDFYSGLSFGRIRLTTPDISIGGSLKSLYIPSVTDGKTLGTIDGNQNFTDVGTIASENITVTGKVSTTDSISIGTPSASAGILKLYTGSGLFEGRIQGGGIGVLTMPNETGTIATINGNQNFTNMGSAVADSVVSDNNYAILYSDTKIAGSSAGDTSANFTTFLNTTNGLETKVRLTYLHRRGNVNLKAYYQIKGTDVTAVSGTLRLYTMAGVQVSTASNTSTAGATYEPDDVTLSVSGLTSNTLYEVRFIASGTAVTDIPEVKNLTIVATSN